jgi:predicted RNase H-like nuclease
VAIRARGEWVPGLIDPASRGRSQEDGKRLMVTYTQLGLSLEPDVNAVEAGLYEVWMRLTTQRLRVFATLQNLLAEYRLYRRDEKGEVVKEHDHLMDCMRGLMMSGRERAKARPAIRRSMLTSQGIGDPVAGV